MIKLLAAALILLSSGVLAQVPPDPLKELRYCGAPARNADGSIKRRTAVLTAFQRTHPCPSTGLTDKACPGWAMDHVVPLACGGCDAVWNLQWLPNSLKSCAGTVCKDRFERKIYCTPMQVVPTASP
jgi:hypothetical protein